MTILGSAKLRAEDRVVLERLQTAMGSEGKKSAIEITQAWSSDKRESVQTQKLKLYWEGYHLLQYITHIRNSIEPSTRDRLERYVVKHVHHKGFAAIQSFPTAGKTTGIAAHRVSAIFKIAGGFQDHSSCTPEDHQECKSDLSQCKYSLLMGMLGYLEFCRDQQLPIAQFAEEYPNASNSTPLTDNAVTYINGPGLDQSIKSLQDYLSARNIPTFANETADAPQPVYTAEDAPQASTSIKPAQSIWSRAALSALSMVVIMIAALWFYRGQSSESDYEQAVSALSKKQYASAISLLNRTLKKNSDLVEAYYLLGEAYTGLADNENAIKFYREGIEKDPQMQARAYNNLALLLLAQDRVSDTLVLLDQAEANIRTTVPSEKWAQSGILFKNRAWAHWRMDSNVEALKFIERAQKFLGSAQKLDDYPEVFCLHALVAKDIELKNLATQECIARFKDRQKNQLATDTGAILKPLSGVSYDLYLQVLKQQTQF